MGKKAGVPAAHRPPEGGLPGHSWRKGLRTHLCRHGFREQKILRVLRIPRDSPGRGQLAHGLGAGGFSQRAAVGWDQRGTLALGAGTGKDTRLLAEMAGPLLLGPCVPGGGVLPIAERQDLFAFLHGLDLARGQGLELSLGPLPTGPLRIDLPEGRLLFLPGSTQRIRAGGLAALGRPEGLRALGSFARWPRLAGGATAGLLDG